MNLFLLVHVDPSVVPIYRAAIAHLPEPWELCTLNAGAFSSAYTALGRELRTGDGGILVRAAARAGAALPFEKYMRIALLTFSAGYAFAREVLSTADAEKLDALVLIDSAHAALDPDGTALDAQVLPFVKAAQRALDGKAAFWLGHTDVKTPQKGSGAFASTTQFADELMRLLGRTAPGKRPPSLQIAPLCRVEARDERTSDHDEHINALTGWGAAFAAQALDALARHVELGISSPSAPSPVPAPPVGSLVLRRGSRGTEVRRWQETLQALGFPAGSADGIFGARTETATIALQSRAGVRADGVVGHATRVAAEAFGQTAAEAEPASASSARIVEHLITVARAEFDAGARERPLGSNAGADVERYLEGEIAAPAQWCGAFLRWCLRQAAARAGEKPVVEGSLGAKVWMSQFQKLGRWASGRHLRTGAHTLRPGMIVVLHRGAPGAWTGHVALVIGVDMGRGAFTTIEGNSGSAGDRVGSMSRALNDPALLGAGWLD